MSFIDTSMWIAGLGLQVVLLFLLVRRRLVLQAPLFSVLIAFYLLRAAVLFEAFPHMSRDGYNELYSALSTLDLVLQILVAIEITIKILRSIKGTATNHRLRSTAIIITGLTLAIGTTALMPLRGPLPVDRGMVFITAVAILLVIWTAIAHVRGLPRRVAEGFAVYGLAGIFAAFERSYAMLHRSSGAFAAASYVQSGAYICVVVFWILTLPTNEKRPQPV